MKVVGTRAELREALDARRGDGDRIGFVPTMGALHEGHLSLIGLAHEHADLVVISIFVNPLQFGPSEDLEAYPRDRERDLELARAAGAQLAFLPSQEEMYPPGAATRVDVGRLGSVFEGAERPGHFEGVATVVAKLFNLVRPNVAVFGQKDAQQVAVIRQMVRDLSFDIEIVVGDIVRAADGLALSSRNAYLSGGERQAATALHRALTEGRAVLEAGGGVADAEVAMVKVFEGQEGVELGYARAVDPQTFETGPGRDILLVVAARIGSTRLIDNMLVTV